MNRENIENLEELLVQKLGKTKKISSTKISRLTALGENYGGLLLKVDLTLEDRDGKQEDFHAVAKTIPVSTFMQKIFDIQVTVKKESAFYTTIVPLLREFQKEQGVEDLIDIFPEFYGARLNLNGSDIVDESSVILMENLVHAGYKNVDRYVGFDLQTTKLILKDLAIFHSTFLALKICKPDVFQSKISPYLTPAKPPPPPPSGASETASPIHVLKEFFYKSEEIRQFLPKIKDLLDAPPTPPAPRPSFIVCHNDLWVNNIMVKFEDEKPVASKLVDFQNLTLRSPASDLLFLLNTSVQQSVLEQNLDHFIAYYHEHFVANLIRHKCDPTSYSFEKLLEEIELDSKPTLGQSMFMILFVVLKKKGFLGEEDPSTLPDFGTVDDVSVEARQRILFLLNTFDKKGWL